MTTAKELCTWATMLRESAVKLEDNRLAEQAARLAIEFDRLAATQALADWQLA